MTTLSQPNQDLDTLAAQAVEGNKFERVGQNRFQAKASVDNGAGNTPEHGGCGMPGEVSRVDAGRTASATSERMDVTVGRDRHFNSRSAGTSPTRTRAHGGGAPDETPSQIITNRHFGALGLREEAAETDGVAADTAPAAGRPMDTGRAGK